MVCFGLTIVCCLFAFWSLNSFCKPEMCDYEIGDLTLNYLLFKHSTNQITTRVNITTVENHHIFLCMTPPLLDQYYKNVENSNGFHTKTFLCGKIQKTSSFGQYNTTGLYSGS